MASGSLDVSVVKWAEKKLGSISAALSCPISFPEQRLVIELEKRSANNKCVTVYIL